MCQAPSLDQGSYALEVLIDGIASDNGAKYHAVAYTALTLVSNRTSAYQAARASASKRKETLPRSAGRLRVPGGNPHRSRIRRSG